jgi:uncharacterized DUF497 family protein
LLICLPLSARTTPKTDTEDYGEPRFKLLGMVDGRVLFVAYTMRGDIIRIISAREAEPYERRLYHEEN